MTDEFEVTYRSVRDETIPKGDLTVEKWRRYDFMIGKHGPFTERVSLDTFDPSEIGRRVELLRAHLRGLPK